MEHPILTRISREGFTTFGWFEPRVDDTMPKGTSFAILIGNAGPEMFSRFARERDPRSNLLDDWTRETVQALARDLEATAVFPFDTPAHPFLTWARRAGAGHVSPLGLNIHNTYGLWHAFRAALLFPVAFDLPQLSPGQSPCITCAGKPCLTACPVKAFDGTSYDVSACGQHLLQNPEQTCHPQGCKARLACPVGRNFIYGPHQMAFHMKAFRQARESTA